MRDGKAQFLFRGIRGCVHVTRGVAFVQWGGAGFEPEAATGELRAAILQAIAQLRSGAAA